MDEGRPMNLDLLPPRERLEILASYLDGELDDELAREVSTWLDQHPDALREIEHQRRLWDLLGRYADEPVPADFAGRVLTAAGAGSSSARPSSAHRADGTATRRATPRLARRRWAFAAAAAALVALGVGISALQRGRTTPGSGVEPLSVASIDVDLVQHANLEGLLALSDAEFEALLAEDPDALADASLGG